MKKIVIRVLMMMVMINFCASTTFAIDYTAQNLYPLLSASGVNDQGYVVGTEGGGGFFVIYHGGNWDNYSFPAISGITGYKINNSNQVAGSYNNSSAAFWSAGTTFNNIARPSEASWIIATGINDAGLVVGTYGVGATFYPYTYQNGTLTTFSINFSPDYINLNPYATDVNNKGDIVGVFQNGGSFIYYHDGSVVILDMDSAYGINDACQVVGEKKGLPTLYANGQYSTLNFLGVPTDGQITPTDINNLGQIAGEYYGSGGFGFVSSPVPLPPSFLLLGSGLLGLVGWRRFRKG